MSSRPPLTFRHITAAQPRSSSSERSLQTFPPERYSDLVRRRGGLLSVPGKLNLVSEGAEEDRDQTSLSNRMTRLLLNVNMEGSLGPVHVVMSPESTVAELIKAAVEIYVKEKRRPLLKDTAPDQFRLHYSQFSLESLKGEEKLKNLGSRNFFLCSKPTTLKSSCSEEAKMAMMISIFPLTKLMDFLL